MEEELANDEYSCERSVNYHTEASGVKSPDTRPGTGVVFRKRERELLL
jgi:hypothetical protein